jgi:hypothetical protein
MSNIQDLLDNEIYPSLHASLSSAFPEFGWKAKGNGWIATEVPPGFPGVPGIGSGHGCAGLKMAG